ncbi:coagulation factor X-like [Narcine bancroftii]|uniref:coagulation factor X-like n=1 Tax=Narcine bancroftii TaxID=1343680 RepID=UPI003831E5CF
MAYLFWAINLFLLLINLTGIETEVFLANMKANDFLTRQKRENSFLEELKEGNLERECIEERCSQEEAREYFEDDQRTDEFWTKYVDGNQCESNPCKNQGKCYDGINQYQCTCIKGFKGINCEIEIPKLCTLENGGCHHYCHVHRDQVKCSCVSGFELGSDGKSCIPAERYPCGTIGDQALGVLNPAPTNSSMINDTSAETNDRESDTTNPGQSVVRIVGGQECHLGQCPWQVLLVDEDGNGFCGATILNNLILLTAAHCINQTKTITAVAGEFDVNEDEGTEQNRDVDVVISHHNFQRHNFDNDIAVVLLKKPLEFNQNVVPICLPQKSFAEKVLMHQPNALVSGWGRMHDHGAPSTKLQRLTVPYVNRIKCIESSRYQVSQNMFCAGYENESKDACQGDSGGPHVTPHRNTWFLTGIVSWGEGCAQKGKYGIYTKVSKYTRWIRRAIDELISYYRKTYTNT